MASNAALQGEEIPQPQESPPDTACMEAQKWIEQVTGKSFGDRDFRTGLENGILLCELLNAIKPGLVKKINRLPTPIAGLDNITLFLRGCKELGLKESQLFDPGDLQDTANRTTGRTSDCNRKLRNVLVTVYWLGKAANGCSSFSGTNLDLKEFEGLLAQIRKENEEIESPKRSIRDSGYIDCWDSERSDSLSPPRHGRDDSFDSLDSFGSRSQQTPSPDVVLRGSSDGRGSDSESDLPHRRIPDVRKDDMSARRVSFGENKAFVPFNQYLPNKNNQTAYIPAPLRKKKAEREDYRKSWSTATSPLGGERPFSPKQSPVIKEEQTEFQCEGEETRQRIALKKPCLEAENRSERVDQNEGGVPGQSPTNGDIPNDVEEVRKRKNRQQVGIKVLPATKRFSSQSHVAGDIDGAPDIVLRKENAFLKSYEGMGSDSEEEEDSKVPDIQKDDLATRRARMNQPKCPMQFNQYIQGSYLNKTRATGKQDSSKTSTPTSPKISQNNSVPSNRENQGPPLLKPSDICKEKEFPRPFDNKGDVEAEQEKLPDIQKDDLAKRKAKASVSLPKEPSAFAVVSITKADMETWQRLQVSSEDSEHLNDTQADQQASKIDVARATNDDFGRRKLSLQEKRARNKQKFVHFGPVTEIDQQKWDRLCIAKAESVQDSAEAKGSFINSDGAPGHISSSASARCSQPQEDVITGPVLPNEPRSTPEGFGSPAPPENESEIQSLDTQRDDTMARRTGSLQKLARTNRESPVSHQYALHSQQHEEKCDSLELEEEKQGLFLDVNPQLRRLLLSDLASSSKETGPALESKPLKEAEDVKDDMKEGDSTTDKDPNSIILEKNAVAPDPEKDDMMTRKISVSQKPSCVSLGHFLPVPFSLQRREDETKPISCSMVSTIKSKNASQALPVGKSDAPSKPLNQKETEEHANLADDGTCNQDSNSVETKQQDSLERRTILSPDLANTDSKTTPPLGNISPTITREADAVEGESITGQEPNSTTSKDNSVAPDPEKDDMMTRRISVTQKPSSVGLGHFLPVPFSLQHKAAEKKSTSVVLSSKIKPNNSTQAPAVGSSDLPNKPLDQSETEKPELRTDVTCDQTSIESINDGDPTGKGLDTQTEDALETCDHELFRFSPGSALSDDTESMSMCDMRYEEEGSMLPHSRAHHEHLQHVNSLLKEEDDTWQDDLARWKTRRRSASQDLIKKEEERKKMERLMSGDSELSDRRKSIKTYREIVEEKERREKELHVAYKNAKTRGEAERILKSYIEKFTISEAVLEGLVMPKILERSQSVEPSLLSSSEDPNPLKYLRQQSLPSPKYTSTVEATVTPSSPCESKSPTGLISPSKNIISKTVPMLTAKPYSQPKNTQEVLKTFKVDGKVNLNGVEEQKGKESGSQTFAAPSLTRSQMFEGVARVDAPVVETKQDVASIKLNLARPNTLNSLHESNSLCEDGNHISQKDEPDSFVQEESVHSVEQLSEGNTQSNSTTQAVPAVSSIEIPPLTVNGKDTEDKRKVEAAELIMHWSLDSNYKEAKKNSLPPLKSSENVEESSKIKENVDTECTEKSPALVPNLSSPNRSCTWDPEEERKRQEKWQQEQERLLQERYQKEQEKLKEEWEKAQKEVEEEERKYYEEERKIIEDTVVPLTLSPNSNVHFNISERNGNFIPVLPDHAKRDQENNNGQLMAEPNRVIKNEIHMHSNVTQQQILYAHERSMLAAEETQIKGKTEKWEAEPCNHVQSNECNTPTRLTLQAGCKQVMLSESSDLGSPKTPVDENAVHHNMSSIISTRGIDSKEETLNSSQSTSQCQSPNRSVSGKKLCSTCGLPLGKGAAMIIETLSLYFHIQCFKCGLCKGQLGDATTGTDVRIRNGLLNCNDCYVKSRTAGHPTPL
ncbi:LIM and calponin homology domains-containing protein 1 isoform X2 [Xenopus laevis]|uniref:LIM and calponin homology domains-containing protein 1 isoform X2 n=1 Tax=Xenopus laevis TaxID=8355 RepID=A0A8J0UME1_XENLA|nr:LIM and calponin homology domains-containing protein 1 isoform X2 [Xenopus laevis]